MTRPLRSFRRCDVGATAIETGLVLLLLVTFIIGIVEFSVSYWLLNAMQIAVAQGARYALANRIDSSGNCQDPNSVTPSVVSVVESALPLASGSGQPFSTPSVSCSGGTTNNSCCPSTSASPATITVSVTYNNPLFAFFGFLTRNPSGQLPTIGASVTVPLL